MSAEDTENQNEEDYCTENDELKESIQDCEFSLSVIGSIEDSYTDFIETLSESLEKTPLARLKNPLTKKHKEYLELFETFEQDLSKERERLATQLEEDSEKLERITAEREAYRIKKFKELYVKNFFGELSRENETPREYAQKNLSQSLNKGEGIFEERQVKGNETLKTIVLKAFKEETIGIDEKTVNKLYDRAVESAETFTSTTPNHKDSNLPKRGWYTPKKRDIYDDRIDSLFLIFGNSLEVAKLLN